MIKEKPLSTTLKLVRKVEQYEIILILSYWFNQMCHLITNCRPMLGDC